MSPTSTFVQLLVCVLLGACAGSDFGGSNDIERGTDDDGIVGDPRRQGDPAGQDGADGGQGQDALRGGGDQADGGDPSVGDDDQDGGGDRDLTIEDGDTRLNRNCDKPQGQERSTVVMGGEDYPGNPVDGGIGDYNDFLVTLGGDLLVERGSPAKIGVPKPGTITFNYVRDLGQSNCIHAFKLLVRRCPNRDSTPIAEIDVPVGLMPLASESIEVEEADVFVDIILTTSPNPLSSYCKGFPAKDFALLDPAVSPLMPQW